MTIPVVYFVRYQYHTYGSPIVTGAMYAVTEEGFTAAAEMVAKVAGYDCEYVKIIQA